MGLFRIIYSLFYLWHLSVHSSDLLSGMPEFYVEYRVYLVKYFFEDFGTSFSPFVFHALEAVLVAALTLLAFGYKTRLATAIVLLDGCFLEALLTAFDGKRTLVPMVFYIPFFMLISNSWAKTYSIDALLRKREGGFSADPRASSWEYFLPARALLAVFSGLFFVSAIHKVAFGGAWDNHFDMMSNFFLNRNIEAATYELPLNWFAPYMAQNSLIYLSAHINTLAFETFFFLTLIGRRVRSIIVSLALMFHAVNAIWLVVTVTPIAIGYCAFIDWQAIKEFCFPPSAEHSRRLLANSTLQKLMPMLAISLATALGLLWHSDAGVRTLFNLNGLINWRTLWFPVLPFALGWFVLTLSRYRRIPAKESASL